MASDKGEFIFTLEKGNLIRCGALHTDPCKTLGTSPPETGVDEGSCEANLHRAFFALRVQCVLARHSSGGDSRASRHVRRGATPRFRRHTLGLPMSLVITRQLDGGKQTVAPTSALEGTQAKRHGNTSTLGQSLQHAVYAGGGGGGQGYLGGNPVLGEGDSPENAAPTMRLQTRPMVEP